MIIFSFKTKEELKTELNKYGKDNWEVIYYSEKDDDDKFSSKTMSRIIFKRQKQ